jgi:hypothetical protein
MHCVQKEDKQFEYIYNLSLKLPPLKYWSRYMVCESQQPIDDREARFERRPSSYVNISGVWLRANVQLSSVAKPFTALTYVGILFRGSEYDSMKLACYTGIEINEVHLGGGDGPLVLVGDPRRLAAQCVCLRGPYDRGIIIYFYYH